MRRSTPTRRSFVYPPIGSHPPQMNEMLAVLEKYHRDVSFIKYLFLANCVVVAILLMGSVHLLWGDSTNKLILQKFEKLLAEVRNSSKVQTTIKGMLKDLFQGAVQDEENKRATQEFFLNILQNSKSPLGSVFTDVLQTEHVRNSLKDTLLDVSTYLCNNEQVQMKVYHLLSEAIHLPIAVNTSKKWLNDLLKSDSVTNNVREVLRDEIFKNEEVLNDSVAFVQNALLSAIRDKKTKEMSKLFFASVLSNPEIQQQISGNLWKIIKLAVSPKWMTYEGDELHLEVESQSPSARGGARGEDPLLDAGRAHVGTISCDVCEVSDVRHVGGHLGEGPPERGELLPLGRNRGGADEEERVVSERGAAADEEERVANQTGDAANESAETANQMRRVITLFERADTNDEHADVTACEQTYVGQPFQIAKGGSFPHVGVEHLGELRSFLLPPHPSGNISPPLKVIPMSKFRSLREGAGHLTSLRRDHGASGSSGANGSSGATPPGTASHSSDVPNAAPLNCAPLNSAPLNPACGMREQMKFFLLDAYRFYAQKYYFYYYYVERVKEVLQKALGVKFF